MIDPKHGWNVSYKPTIVGFIFSLILTLAAYLVIIKHCFIGWGLILVLLVLAIVQGLIQLIFFLHLGVDSRPRWNLMIFALMVFIMIIILAGSMWIMRNLDYNMMPKRDYISHG